MRTDHDLIQLLDDEPPTPSAVDVRGAIAAGRRRRTVHRAGWAGAATIALAVAAVATVNGTLFAPSPAPTDAAGPAAVPASCVVRDLTGVPSSLVRGADATGRHLAGSTDPGAGAVLVHDGRSTAVELPGAGRSALTAVAADGTAVGWRFATDGDAAPVPFVYRQGTASALPGVAYGTPQGINDAGTIVGTSGGFPVRWPSATQDAVRLPVPPGTRQGSAIGIDDDGTIVGSIDGKAFAWLPDGTTLELPSPEIGGVTATMTMAFGIRNGWVAGSAHTTERPPVGDLVPSVVQSVSVLWNVRTGTMRVIEPARAEPAAVSADGWLAGVDADGGPVLVAGATTLRLPLPAGSMTMAGSTFTISADGRNITGSIVDASAARRSVRWQCS
ncbi:hypothetical protein Aph02nite_26580 [Actinoplanes philippinensis]|uniref:Uncharacterized protein n=1 Tax=Actinoplanes philippinensis TaxID=35752 RepID=A0A1I2GAK1_9ACTN|nr:hypothetical protein [Actinoplanes philippinensis]GIE76708.1 hypothetical protein Aph02nite_26580 [Actinoplanes philippinensis]SFF13691.1 hypothetical protein SAMN05421541_106314 [Actinoplanes philippinensis]